MSGKTRLLGGRRLAGKSRMERSWGARAGYSCQILRPQMEMGSLIGR